MNPIEDLHKMLDEAGIPHEFHQKKVGENAISRLWE